ncbi:RIP metalloprotease [Patescibacteria group bacterium]
MDIFITILIFVLVLGLLIFVHELGHFLAAKKAGVRVEEFGFGYPPRLFSIKKGETRYSINLLPLGGFVKLTGEDGKKRNDPRSFAAKRGRKRGFILIAGVLGNLIFAFLIFAVISQLGTPTIVGDDIEPSNLVKDPGIQVVSVVPDTPAAQSGFELGDVITQIETDSISTTTDVQEALENKNGKPVDFTVSRGDEQRNITATPRTEYDPAEGALGLGYARVALVKAPWYMAPYEGMVLTLNATGQIIRALGEIIISLFPGAENKVDVVGFVGIAVVTGQMTELGWSFFLQFVALLSINLMIINILPLPALDGGRLLFVFIETLRGKKISPRVESIVHASGFILLLILFVAITISDVFRFDVLDRIKNFF